jgi:sirohydrochlorin ferrochelatase
VLLTQGFHATDQLPHTVADGGRGDGPVLTAGLGAAPELVDAIVRQARRLTGPGSADAWLLVGSGSRQGVPGTGALLAGAVARRLAVPVETAVLSGSGPCPTEIVERLRREGRERIAVVSHLLFPGVFHTRLTTLAADLHLGPVTPPLGSLRPVADLLARRYRGVRSLRGPLRVHREVGKAPWI